MSIERVRTNVGEVPIDVVMIPARTRPVEKRLERRDR
jgi:hypothetical protein